MGMFDYVRCEPDTPDGWKPDDGLFQTKNFVCAMVCHTITAGGSLMLERIIAYHEVPKDERPYPDAEPGSLQEICGSIREEIETRMSDFHGVMNFYALEKTGYAPDDRYPGGKRPIYRCHDYFAKFTDGKLVSITGGAETEGAPPVGFV